MTATSTRHTTDRQATVEDEEPEDLPNSVVNLPDDTIVKERRQAASNYSNQPGTGDIQTSGGAFSRPVEWYEEGAMVKLTHKRDGTHGYAREPIGLPTPGTLYGKWKHLEGKRVPVFTESSIFVPGGSPDGSGVTDGKLYPLRGVKIAMGTLREDRGALAWGDAVDAVMNGETKGDASVKSDHFFTYGKLNYVHHDGPE